MSQWAYEMSHEELVNYFMRICARAGTASSGLVIDVTGLYEAAEAKYLKGVLLARLDGQKPPFKREEEIEVTADSVYVYHGRNLKKGEHLTIERIYYQDKKWFVTFKGIEGEEVIPPLYPVKEHFKALTAPTVQG